MRYDRYGRRGDTSARGSQHSQPAPGRPEGSLRRGSSTTRRPRRARGRVDRASRWDSDRGADRDRPVHVGGLGALHPWWAGPSARFDGVEHRHRVAI